MKNSLLKKSGSMLLSMALVLTFVFALPQEASAASKTKKFQVQSSSAYTDTYTNTDYNGNLHTETSKGSSVYKYKNGLCTQINNNDGKTVYTRNKKGYVTQIKRFDKAGKLKSVSKLTVNKNGDITKEQFYSVNGSTHTLDSTTTKTYWKKGAVKQSVTTDRYGTSTSTYDKYGNITSYTSKDTEATYT